MRALVDLTKTPGLDFLKLLLKIQMVEQTKIGIAGLDIYIPQGRMSADELAALSSIPTDVIKEKFGIVSKPVAKGENVTDMCAKAAIGALKKTGIKADELDEIIYCGSEFKDHYVWSAAIRIAHLLSASKAIAYDMAVLCVGMVMAIKKAKDTLTANPQYQNILLVSGSREESLLDYTNKRSRFMFNFGEGASAVVVSRTTDGNEILEGDYITDGSLSEFVHVPQIGNVAWEENRIKSPIMLDVTDPEGMKNILNDVSEKNFIHVIEASIKKSGFNISQLDYLAILHMKRSIHDYLLEKIGVNPGKTTYLDHYGHIQSSDPLISIYEGLKSNKIKEGDNVVMAAAGTGYTWGALTIKWGKTL